MFYVGSNGAIDSTGSNEAVDSTDSDGHSAAPHRSFFARAACGAEAGLIQELIRLDPADSNGLKRCVSDMEIYKIQRI